MTGLQVQKSVSPVGFISELHRGQLFPFHSWML